MINPLTFYLDFNRFKHNPLSLAFHFNFNLRFLNYEKGFGSQSRRDRM